MKAIKRSIGKKFLFVFTVIPLINGCGVSGHYRSEGPCQGFHKDQEACERAANNSSVIGNINLGHTLNDVRQIMGKGPEIRKADSSDSSESWGYRTSYNGNRFTTIIFKNGVVTEIK